MSASCEPIKLVVLCHVVHVKLTDREGKTHGKHAGKQQKGTNSILFLPSSVWVDN